MNDKEILGELKKSFECLYDIRENGCSDHCNGQLEHNLIKKLDVAMANIEDIYRDFYKTLDKEDLKLKDEIYIASNITGDYELEKDLGYLSCEDLDYYWYKDEKFLNK